MIISNVVQKLFVLKGQQTWNAFAPQDTMEIPTLDVKISMNVFKEILAEPALTASMLLEAINVSVRLAWWVIHCMLVNHHELKKMIHSENVPITMNVYVEVYATEEPVQDRMPVKTALSVEVTLFVAWSTRLLVTSALILAIPRNVVPMHTVRLSVIKPVAIAMSLTLATRMTLFLVAHP